MIYFSTSVLDFYVHIFSFKKNEEWKEKKSEENKNKNIYM